MTKITSLAEESFSITGTNYKIQNSMAIELNDKEAYKAMYVFLDELYNSFGNDVELGAVLGSMSFLGDEKPTDAALWDIWLQSIDKVKKGESDIYLKLNN